MKKLQGPAARRGLPPGEAPPAILGKGAGGSPQANASWWQNTLRQPGRREGTWTGKKTGNIRTDKQLAEHIGTIPVRAAKLGAVGGVALGARELLERLPEGPDLDLNLPRDSNPSQEQLPRTDAYEPTDEYDDRTIIEDGLIADNFGGPPGAITPETYEEWLDSTGGVAGAESMDSWDKGLALAQISSALLGAKKGRLGEALGEGIKQATPVMMAGRKGERDRRQQDITNRLAYQGLADKQGYYDALSENYRARAGELLERRSALTAQEERSNIQGEIGLGESIMTQAENMAKYGTRETPAFPRVLPEWEGMNEEERAAKIQSLVEQLENRILVGRGLGENLLRRRGAKAGGLVGSSGGTVAEKMNFR